MANVENIRKWVDALRSGRYEQGAGSLHPGDQFCCLGVACEISGLGTWDRQHRSGDTAYVIAADNVDNQSVMYMPNPVVQWLGVGYFNPKVGSAHLATLNDRGKPFAEIADLIEAEWLS